MILTYLAFLLFSVSSVITTPIYSQTATRNKREESLLITRDSLPETEKKYLNTGERRTEASASGGYDLPANFNGSGNPDFAFSDDSYQPEEIPLNTDSIYFEQPFEITENNNNKVTQNWRNDNKYNNWGSDIVPTKNSNSFGGNLNNPELNNEQWRIKPKPWDTQNENNKEIDWSNIVFLPDSPTFENNQERTNNQFILILTTTEKYYRSSFPPFDVNACQRKCHARITNEYNPMCGSDGVTYSNPGKLSCAKKCGKKIWKSTHSTCGRFAPRV